MKNQQFLKHLAFVATMASILAVPPAHCQNKKALTHINPQDNVQKFWQTPAVVQAMKDTHDLLQMATPSEPVAKPVIDDSHKDRDLWLDADNLAQFQNDLPEGLVSLKKLLALPQIQSHEIDNIVLPRTHDKNGNSIAAHIMPIAVLLDLQKNLDVMAKQANNAPVEAYIDLTVQSDYAGEAARVFGPKNDHKLGLKPDNFSKIMLSRQLFQNQSQVGLIGIAAHEIGHVDAMRTTPADLLLDNKGALKREMMADEWATKHGYGYDLMVGLMNLEPGRLDFGQRTVPVTPADFIKLFAVSQIHPEMPVRLLTINCMIANPTFTTETMMHMLSNDKPILLPSKPNKGLH